jgi:hypothetical protein
VLPLIVSSVERFGEATREFSRGKPLDFPRAHGLWRRLFEEHSFRVYFDDDGRAVCSLSRVPSSSFNFSPAFVIRNKNSVNFYISLMIFHQSAVSSPQKS